MVSTISSRISWLPRSRDACHGCHLTISTGNLVAVSPFVLSFCICPMLKLPRLQHQCLSKPNPTISSFSKGICHWLEFWTSHAVSCHSQRSKVFCVFNSIYQLFKIDVEMLEVLKHVTVIEVHDVDFRTMDFWQGFVQHIVLFFQSLIQNMPCLSCCMIDMIF